MSVIPFPRVGLQKGPAALLPPIPIFDTRDSGLALHAQARLVERMFRDLRARGVTIG